jgi:hypothetical protein
MLEIARELALWSEQGLGRVRRVRDGMEAGDEFGEIFVERGELRGVAR